MYRQYFNSTYYSAGDVLRGYLDDEVRIKNMLSFNFDLPFRALHFYPSEWTGNRKWHIIDFDLFLSPFFDAALAASPYNGYNPDDAPTSFSFKDMLMSGGLEMVVFPGFFRSLYLRFSMGYNINQIRRDGLKLKWGFFPQWEEFYIGTGLHY
jgi:hypothetical protein